MTGSAIRDAIPTGRGGRASARASARLRVHMDPLRLGLFLLTIVTVSRIHQHFGFIARFRPALLLVAITAVYAYLNPKKLSTWGMLKTWPAKLMVALLVFACVSAPFGLSLGGSASFIIGDYSKTLIYAFLLIAAIRGAADLYTLVWAYVVSSGILVWMSLFVFGLSQASDDALARLSHLYTYDANDVGLVLIVGLALTLLAMQTAGTKGKFACVVVVAGIGATIARSGSRGAFVGLAAFGLALLLLLHAIPIAKRIGFLVATVFALAIAAPPGYWTQMKTIFAPTEDYNWTTTDGRKEVALRGLGYMLDYPIFGVGMNNFWRAECFFSSKADESLPGVGIRCTAPHNSYVQAGAELGLPGLVMWAGLVFGGVGAMIRLRKRLPRAWARGDPEERFLHLSTTYLAVAMIGFGVSALFVSFAWLDIVYILAAFMSGLYMAVHSKLRQDAALASSANIPPPAAPAPPAAAWRQPGFLPPPRG